MLESNISLTTLFLKFSNKQHLRWISQSKCVLHMFKKGFLSLYLNELVTVSISNLSSNTGNQLVKIEHFYLILNAFDFDLSFFKLMVNFFLINHTFFQWNICLQRNLCISSLECFCNDFFHNAVSSDYINALFHYLVWETKQLPHPY